MALLRLLGPSKCPHPLSDEFRRILSTVGNPAGISNSQSLPMSTPACMKIWRAVFGDNAVETLNAIESA